VQRNLPPIYRGSVDDLTQVICMVECMFQCIQKDIASKPHIFVDMIICCLEIRMSLVWNHLN